MNGNIIKKSPIFMHHHTFHLNLFVALLFAGITVCKDYL